MTRRDGTCHLFILNKCIQLLKMHFFVATWSIETDITILLFLLMSLWLVARSSYRDTTYKYRQVLYSGFIFSFAVSIMLVLCYITFVFLFIFYLVGFLWEISYVAIRAPHNSHYNIMLSLSVQSFRVMHRKHLYILFMYSVIHAFVYT